MARTERTSYRNEPIRDVQYGSKCPEANCDTCVQGQAKRRWRRQQRHERWERWERDAV